MKYGNYSINEESESSISKILAGVKSGTKVIEFGAASGYILEYLRDEKKCEVHGYEIDSNAVAIASEKGIKTTLIDLNKVDESFFEKLDTDINYIICADILEHLTGMERFLQCLASYMSVNRDCILLISFPNITYYGVIEDLLHGIFKYRELGILDNTHLRFYDKFELVRIFNNNNLEVLSVENVVVTPEESEFNVELSEQVTELLDSYGNRDYLSYQYIFKLSYSDGIKKNLFEENKGLSVGKSLCSERAEAVLELSNTIERKDKQICELNGEVTRKDNQIIQLNSDVNRKDSQTVQLNKDVNRKDSQVILLNEVLGLKNNEIVGLNKSLTELHRKKDSVEGEFKKQRDIIVSERDRARNDFMEMRRSSSWRMTVPFRFVGHLIKGNFDIAESMMREVACRCVQWLPARRQGKSSLFQHFYAQILHTMEESLTSTSNSDAISAIVNQRFALTRGELSQDPLCYTSQQDFGAIDISIVTYNSSRWIPDFVESLIAIDYPHELLTLCFVDNSSTDTTVKDLQDATRQLETAGFAVHITEWPNNGFGAGHNVAIAKGISPFCLVTNIDISFESDALRQVMAVAQEDTQDVAAWELHQKPYEHPKFNDPVTGLTNWNSHACVLLRRSALDKVGNYDESLFMYGEDVELSYRLRRAGFLLRYCPNAVVWHYTYESANQIKPLQYIGSTYANLYLRLKYGTIRDIFAVSVLATRLLRADELYLGSRRHVLRSMLKLFVMAPKALLSRRPTKAYFPFHKWDYEIAREGAFVKQVVPPESPPLVSVITRTYRGREVYLRQALLSVAHQTYPNIEHIVVEDGGETMRSVVDNVSQKTGNTVRFIKLDKLGRSAAGNAGLSVAKGRWCVFLDDDDLLFADHVEALVNTLIVQQDAVAAYSLAWEVKTNIIHLEKGTYSEASHEVLAILRHEFDNEALQRYNFIAIQSLLFERHLFTERGGFEVDMDALEDWVLWKKYAHGNRFHYVPKVTSMFRTPVDPEILIKRQQVLDEAYSLAVEKSNKPSR